MCIKTIKTLTFSGSVSRWEPLKIRVPRDSQQNHIRTASAKSAVQSILSWFERTITRFDNIKGKFERTIPRFDSINGKFERTIPRVDNIKGKFERTITRFDSAKNKFERTIPRFDSIKGKFERTNPRFDDKVVKDRHIIDPTECVRPIFNM